MLQKEVVDRLTAELAVDLWPHQRQCATALRGTKGIDVLPEAFTPPPKVESAVVRLRPYSVSPHPVKDVSQLQSLCLTAFNQRRKTIRNNLKKLIDDTQLETLGINPSARPETLSVADYCRISDWLTDNQKSL